MYSAFVQIKPTFEVGDNHEEKLRELMLYVAKKCAGHSKFGGTKHNKILFFADFNAFRMFGKPITGTKYWRQEFGPVAARYVQAKNQLIEDKRATTEECFFPGFNPQRRLVALGEPNLDLFTAKEIALVDMIIENLRDLSAEKVSELSHDRAWKAASRDYVEIPYESVYISDDPLSPGDDARFRELIIAKGWYSETEKT